MPFIYYLAILLGAAIGVGVLAVTQWYDKQKEVTETQFWATIGSLVLPLLILFIGFGLMFFDHKSAGHFFEAMAMGCWTFIGFYWSAIRLHISFKS